MKRLYGTGFVIYREGDIGTVVEKYPMQEFARHLNMYLKPQFEQQKEEIVKYVNQKHDEMKKYVDRKHDDLRRYMDTKFNVVMNTINRIYDKLK